MDEIIRRANGTFAKGQSGGRNGGRKRRPTSADDALHDAFAEPITIVEAGRRRTVSKMAATAKQIANEGATGKGARAALAALQKAGERQRAQPAPEQLTASDQEIVDELFARLRAAILAERP